MGILLYLFTLLANCLLALKFVDRNNTHQLFEYTFSETECENGLFHVHEFESGVSFGSLTTGRAIQCIGRSGYRSVPLTTSYSFESNGTVAPMIDRLVETKEFSIECWIKVEEQSFVLSQLLSVAEITSAVYDSSDLFSIEQYADSILFILQTGTSPTSINMYNVEEPYVHLVITARMRQSGTDLATYVNGTLLLSRTTASTFYDLWSKTYRLYGSLARSGGPFIPRWNGEVYYIGWFDHVLSASQIQHNFACSVPPSLPSLEPRFVHGFLNTRFPIHLPVHDYNLNSQTNLLPGYTVTVRLLSLPHIGQLYSHTNVPISALPTEGRVLTNWTLFYQPPPDVYSAEPLTNLTVILSSPYGTSSVKMLSIFVDWMNHPPVVHDAHYAFTTAEQCLTTLTIDDEDGDKDYTRIIDVSSHCRIVDLPTNRTLHAFHFHVEYLGGDQVQSSDSCVVRLVVGDTHNAESAEAVITYEITNALLPVSSVLFVEQGRSSPVGVKMGYRGNWVDDVRLEVLSAPLHGVVEWMGGGEVDSVNRTMGDTIQTNRTMEVTTQMNRTMEVTTQMNRTIDDTTQTNHTTDDTTHTNHTTPPNTIIYTSQPLYFSDPSTDINGNDLGMENETLLLSCIHRSLRSPPFNITLIIRHRNTAPTLFVPDTVWFSPFETTALHDILINDTDRDTQLARLRLYASTSYINVNTSLSDPLNPVRWVGGNVGQGMDDTLVELEGSLSAFAAIVNNVTFRGIYRMNDTLVVTLVDGPHNVSAMITLAYLPRETTATTPRFWILVILIAVLLVIWLCSLCVRVCSLCRCRREKTLPVGMRPSVSPPVHASHDEKPNFMNGNHDEKPNSANASREAKQIPEHNTDVISQPPKKTPPPLPSSLPPAIARGDNANQKPKKRPPPLPTTEPPSHHVPRQTERATQTPDNIEVISRRTVKPPSQ